MTVDARNFLLNTDYPLDKIVYIHSGSFSATGGGGVGTYHSVVHDLPFTPLMVGNWSTSSDFSITKEMFIPSYTELTGAYCEVASDSSDFTIQAINYDSSPITVYYRVYGFMPSTSDETAAPTSSIADNFMLNTDYNYTKLYYNDCITAETSTTITHNLGYRPQVMAWYQSGSQAKYLSSDFTHWVTTTDTTVVVHNSSTGASIHLRIYLDSQT